MKKHLSIPDPNADCMVAAETVVTLDSLYHMLPHTSLFLHGGGYYIS